MVNTWQNKDLWDIMVSPDWRTMSRPHVSLPLALRPQAQHAEHGCWVTCALLTESFRLRRIPCTHTIHGSGQHLAWENQLGKIRGETLHDVKMIRWCVLLWENVDLFCICDCCALIKIYSGVQTPLEKRVFVLVGHSGFSKRLVLSKDSTTP